MLGHQNSLGHKDSEETRKNKSQAVLGRKDSKETRKKKSKAKSKENHPNWQGGISYDKYCSLFNYLFKKKIRDSYHNKCFLCNKTKKENGQNLSVHHVNYNKDCLCGSPCEFVPLCATCHTKTNFNRKYWEDLIIHYLYPERYFLVDI